MPRLAPHVLAGIGGMIVVAALTVAQEMLVHARGEGLGAGWLLLLLVPGVLAAHLIWRRGGCNQEAAVRSGLRSGIITGHLAAPLLAVLLLVAVATTDWARYAGQVGPEIADTVHSAAWSATPFLGILAAMLGYAGCAVAGFVGALIYTGLRGMINMIK